MIAGAESTGTTFLFVSPLIHYRMAHLDQLDQSLVTSFEYTVCSTKSATIMYVRKQHDNDWCQCAQR